MPLPSSFLETASRWMLFSQVDPTCAQRELCRLETEGLVFCKRFARRQEIYSPASYQSCLGLVLEGRVLVEKEGGILLNALGPGDCFGAAALFCDTVQYVTTVRAASDAQVLFLRREALEQLFAALPATAVNYIRFLSGRIQFLNRQLHRFTAPSAEETLLRYLESEQKAAGGQNPLRLRLSLSRLAETLNMGRSSLYRSLQLLESQGRIRRDGRCITLLPPEPHPSLSGPEPDNTTRDLPRDETR